MVFAMGGQDFEFAAGRDDPTRLAPRSSPLQDGPGVEVGQQARKARHEAGMPEPIQEIVARLSGGRVESRTRNVVRRGILGKATKHSNVGERAPLACFRMARKE